MSARDFLNPAGVLLCSAAGVLQYCSKALPTQTFIATKTPVDAVQLLLLLLSTSFSIKSRRRTLRAAITTALARAGETLMLDALTFQLLKGHCIQPQLMCST
jgi:hypothetical protein